MKCPYCEADTKVVKSRWVQDGHGVARTRECLGPDVHRFSTTETQPRQSLDRVVVRRSGDQGLADSIATGCTETWSEICSVS